MMNKKYDFNGIKDEELTTFEYIVFYVILTFVTIFATISGIYNIISEWLSLKKKEIFLTFRGWAKVDGKWMTNDRRSYYPLTTDEAYEKEKRGYDAGL
jgi:hypothetical protein